jgi:hypothetical protein
MIAIPIPATLDLADRMDGAEFEVTTLVRRKGNELEVVSIEGEPVTAKESEEEDEGGEVEVEMDSEAFGKALKGGGM